MEPNNLNAVEVEVLVDGTPCDFTTVSLRQSMTGHHVFEIGVSFRHDKPSVWEETIDEVIRRNLGKQVAVNMTHIASEDTNEFIGIVTDVEIVGIDGDKGSVVLHGGSPTIILDRDPAMDSFTDYNLSNIVEETIERSGVNIELVNAPESDTVIPYVARYRETSFGFLSRVMAAYGEWFYYDGNRLVVGNPHDNESCDVGYDIELSEIRIKTGLRNLNVELYDYNPSLNEYLEDVPPQNIEGVNLYMQAAGEIGETFYTNPAKLPAGYPIRSDSDIVSAVRTHHSRDYSLTSHFTARCKTCGIKVGGLATATIPDSFDNVSFRDLGRFRVLEVHHTVDKDGHYENVFTGVAGLTEALPANHITRPQAFPEPAVVVDNDDPLKQGRIRVRYMWQPEDKTTNWLRVQTPDAGVDSEDGKNRGFVFIPEVEDQVMVGFEYGDPDRPYVMGSLFHKDSSDGAADDNHIKAISTRSGHLIEFNDDPDGQWGLTITDKAGNVVRLDTAGKNIEITAPETISMAAKNIRMAALEDVEIAADGNITAAAKTDITVAAKSDIAISSDGDTDIRVKGSLSSNSTGETSVSGQSVTVVGKSSTDIEGQTTTVKGQLTTVQGASHKIDVM